MTFDIRPDPARPAGGHAILTLPASAEQPETVTVTLFDQYAEQYLGEGGWQSTPVSFGPYAVSDGAVRIGPEIVNQMEEYKAVRLSAGSASDEVVWPDDVVPSPDMAVPGGMTVPFSKTDDTPLRGTVAPPKPPGGDGGKGPDGGKEPGGEPAPPPPTPTPSAGGKAMWIWGGLGLLVLIAAAVALWYFLLRTEPQPEPVPEPVPAPAPEPDRTLSVQQPDPCAADARATLTGQPFAAALAAFGSCGGAFEAEEAFELVDAGARAGDGQALLILGQLYDSASQNETVEGGIGLSLPEDPSKAAEYYARASQIGVTEAVPLLTTVCGKLTTSDNTLWQSAAETYCP